MISFSNACNYRQINNLSTPIPRVPVHLDRYYYTANKSGSISFITFTSFLNKTESETRKMSQSKIIGRIVYCLVFFSFLLYLLLTHIGYCSYCVWQKIMFGMHANNNTLRETKTFSFFVRQWAVLSPYLLAYFSYAYFWKLLYNYREWRDEIHRQKSPWWNIEFSDRLY